MKRIDLQQITSECLLECPSKHGVILVLDTLVQDQDKVIGEQYEDISFYQIKQEIEDLYLKLKDSPIKAIILNHFEEYQDEYQVLLSKIQDVLIKNQSLILIIGKNAARKDIAIQLLTGSPVDINLKGILVETQLETIMKKHYGKLIKKFDTSLEEENTKECLFLQKGNLTNQYLSWFQSYIHADSEVDDFVRCYQLESNEEMKGSKERPFLSIITRTQGKRAETLRELLLSLAGQECMDFEVLVMGHKLEEDQSRMVQKIIDEVPDFLQGKFRLIEVKDGNRTTPINRGFEEARGQYTVLLDDDDLVLDNWVLEFREAAKEHAGAILHAYVVAQDWLMKSGKEGGQILRACGAPQNQFCKDFHVITELNGNYCPVLGLAFPTDVFQKYGIHFDETIDTTEDWDFLMRVRTICGVYDIQKPTSIYRLWKNAENSYSLHAQNIWKENHKKIQEKFKENPIILDSSYMEGLLNLSENHAAILDKSMEKREYGQLTTLYLNCGNGYNENNTVNACTKIPLPDFKYEFTGLEAMGKVMSLRWDPFDKGEIMIDTLEMKIVMKDGKVINRGLRHMTSNGFVSREKIIILHSDPQIYIPIPRNEVISKIIITGHLYKTIPDTEFEYISAAYDPNVIRRTAKHGKRIAKKAIKKVRR